MKNGEFIFDESRDISYLERADYDYLDPEFIGEISRN